MRVLILKIIEQIIYRFSERTSSAVKYSRRNERIAIITHNIRQLILEIKKPEQQNKP